MILTVTLNPSVDHALFVEKLELHDTNRVKRTERDAGGKGVNVARVAAELGAEVLATGLLGGGPGAYVRSVLDAQGVKHDFVEITGETRINFSVEDRSGEPPTTFNEPGPEVSAESFQELRGHCRRMKPDRGWICLGGSLPPGVPNNAFKTLITDSGEGSTGIVLDADGEAFRLGLEAGPTFVKPNSKEAGRLLGKELQTVEDCIAAGREILRFLKPKGSREPMAVISRGAEGAVLVTTNHVFVGHSPKVEVNSTIGSGDSLIGGMLWAFEAGKSLEEALRWGLAAGAATATTNGSEIARRPKVLELLEQSTVEMALNR
ncbi:MAG: 1-phosphofructokinase [Fimbriimonadaceae bacterium]|nr:1-phosphofructokinase [Fimbriimonadaceae bacterium]